MSVHIGSIIKAYCVEHNIKIYVLCRKLGMDNSSVYRMFSHAHINSKTLVKLSATLNHDFFQYFTAPRAPETDAANIALKKELAEAKKEIGQLKTKIETLRRENELLNKFLDKMKPV